MSVAAIVLLVVSLILATQRWFWLLIFFFAGLASFFAMCASVVHFEIIAALGFFILMLANAAVFSTVASGSK